MPFTEVSFEALTAKNSHTNHGSLVARFFMGNPYSPVVRGRYANSCRKVYVALKTKKPLVSHSWKIKGMGGLFS